MAEDKPSIDMQAVSRQFTRVALRMLPFLPGPELVDLVKELSYNRSSLDQKVQKAYSSLQETSRLVSELEDSLQESADKINKLRSEYEHYSKLAEVEEEKANALIKQLEFSLDRRSRRERWISLAINLIAGLIIFVLGILSGPTIKIWLGNG